MQVNLSSLSIIENVPGFTRLTGSCFLDAFFKRRYIVVVNAGFMYPIFFHRGESL
jgi:hypothetical protein